MVRVFPALFLLSVFLFAPDRAEAQKGALTIAPAMVEVVLSENETEETVEFSLINNSSDSVLLDIYPVNFRSKGDYGQIGFDRIGTYDFPLVSYVTFQEKTVEILPQQIRKISAVIQNRQDLSPGGHYVALIAQLSKLDGSSSASELYPALSSLILIRKEGGEQFNLSMKDTNFPRGMFALFYPVEITLLFQNEGNVHVVPYGRVEVRDIFGRLIRKGTINTSSLNVMPSSRRYIAVDMKESSWSLPLSINFLEVKGRDSLNKTNFLFRETYVHINPYLFLLLPISVLIYRKRRKFIKL
jgi:hypothetical protein